MHRRWGYWAVGTSVLGLHNVHTRASPPGKGMVMDVHVLKIIQENLFAPKSNPLEI